jgi:hypothetical protein
VSGCEIARRFDSPMLSRIATQKAAEYVNQAALDSVARFERITGNRASIGDKRQDQPEVGNLVWPAMAPPPGVEDSSDHVVAYAKQEPEDIPFSEHAPRGPVDGDLPQHQIGTWMIMEGGGGNKGEG